MSRYSPSSRITTSPKILTSTPPFSISTNRVIISLIALLLALTSIAQMPSTTGVLPCPCVAAAAAAFGAELELELEL